MKIEHAHPTDAHVDFPNDVENALTFLRYCLADLRVDIDRANDDGLRAMIEVILRHTKFRVGTDEQLQFEHSHVAQLEHYSQQSHRATMAAIANAVKIRSKPDGDDLPW